MKKLSISLLVILMTIVLAACSGTEGAKGELEKNDTNKAEAKVNTSDKEDEKPKEEPEADDSDKEIWTYYDDATWSGEFNGLQIEIQKVVVSDSAPTTEDEDANASAVGVKFRIENTTENKFTTYPDQAVLITSTGEQIDMPDMWISDSVGGDIHGGVIKEGDVIWYLERGHAEDVEWIKLEWNANDESEEDYSKAYHTSS